MVYGADDLGAWLIFILAEEGRKKLFTLVLGSKQERALESAATAAVQRTAEELRPDDAEQAEDLARVIDQVFGEPVPGEPLAYSATVLEALQAGIAAQLAVLDDASLTGTGRSSADVLGVPGTVVAQELTGHLLREIVARGSRGGPLFPLASQLNDDMTHLKLGQLTREVREALARLNTTHAVAVPDDVQAGEIPGPIPVAAPEAGSPKSAPARGFANAEDYEESALTALAQALEPNLKVVRESVPYKLDALIKAGGNQLGVLVKFRPGEERLRPVDVALAVFAMDRSGHTLVGVVIITNGGLTPPARKSKPPGTHVAVWRGEPDTATLAETVRSPLGF